MCQHYLRKFEVTDWSSRQRNTYMYILMNHWIATTTNDSYCLKNCQTYSKSHHLYILCSKCQPPAQRQARRRWRHVANRTLNEGEICPLVFDASFQFVYIRDFGVYTRCRRTFRANSVKMMRLTIRFDDFRENDSVIVVAIQWFIKMYM